MINCIFVASLSALQNKNVTLLILNLLWHIIGVFLHLYKTFNSLILM